MKDWIISIVVFSLVLSLIAEILPETGIKKSALVTMSIVFIITVITPVIKAVNNGFNFNMAKMETILSNPGETSPDYYQLVKSQLKEKLENECENYLKSKGFICEILVDIKSEAENFGEILWVKCKLKANENQKENSDNIEKIIIDLHGINMDKTHRDTNTEDITKHICDFLSVDQEVVYVEF